jgi:hypothetical protein
MTRLVALPIGALIALLAAPAMLQAGAPSHDFDYQLGSWSVRVSRLLHPGTGTRTWVTYGGTHVVTPLWGGRANIGVLEIRGNAGRIEGLQLRLYNPQSQRWKLSFASSTDGELQAPSVGSFHNGIGTFFSNETIGGRMSEVRTVATPLTPTTYRDVISYSFDGGKTWSPMWIATYAKVD